jgi:hypothetical protein
MQGATSILILHVTKELQMFHRGHRPCHNGTPGHIPPLLNLAEVQEELQDMGYIHIREVCMKAPYDKLKP